MNGNSGRGPRRARVPALMIAMTGVALLAGACGGSNSSSTAAGSSPYAKALAYAQCMRSHGMPSFPDPATTNGGIGYNMAGVNTHSPQYQAAQHACQSLNSGRGRS